MSSLVGPRRASAPSFVDTASPFMPTGKCFQRPLTDTDCLSILGGGFLTGAFSRGEHQGTRFDSSHALGSHFQKSFGSDELSQAMAKLEAALKPHGIVPRDAGMRWAAFHSALEETDGIIIRASKLTQLDGALETLRNGPLPVDVVATINGIWRDLEPSRANIL